MSLDQTKANVSDQETFDLILSRTGNTAQTSLRVQVQQHIKTLLENHKKNFHHVTHGVHCAFQKTNSRRILGLEQANTLHEIGVKAAN